MGKFVDLMEGFPSPLGRKEVHGRRRAISSRPLFKSIVSLSSLKSAKQFLKLLVVLQCFEFLDR